MKIIPAILPKDFREIEEKTAIVESFTDTVQIDICDGKFVPSLTWPYKKRDESFEAILREERGMPFWEELDYEFDLMISNPTQEDMHKWTMAGAARIVLHAESSADLMPAISTLKDLVEIGLALNIKTPVDDIKKYADHISYVQLMGIDKVGFQGQHFDDKVLAKIKEVKAAYPHLLIQIDGGVSLETAEDLKSAGADRLIVGSALFDEEMEDIVDTYQKLENI